MAWPYLATQEHFIEAREDSCPQMDANAAGEEGEGARTTDKEVVDIEDSGAAPGWLSLEGFKAKAREDALQAAAKQMQSSIQDQLNHIVE